MAAGFDHAGAVSLLLDRRVDPNPICDSHHTALDTAEEFHFPDVAKVLKERGGRRAAELMSLAHSGVQSDVRHQ
jgi:hypothetical protein